MLNFILNQHRVQTDERPGLVLLDFIRDVKGLPGTKEACREGECGACTVLVGALRNGVLTYKACASCLLPLGDVDGCHVVTVEGLNDDDRLSLAQQLMVDHSASQCGFCTPGIVLSLTAFGLTSPDYSYADALDALDGNLCRCTGYVAIRNAARTLCDRLAGLDRDPQKRVASLIAAGVLPDYFAGIPQQLAQLPHPAPAPFSPSAVLVAGGTDLFVQKPEALLESDLCFLSKRDDLNYVRLDGRLLRVGGAVTLEEFRRHPEVKKHFPSMEKDLLLHSSTILRNKATLTGNIANASPIGDASILLLALDAKLVLAGPDGARREVPLDKFYRGYKQCDLTCGELIGEILLPLLPPGTRFNFEKVSNRVILDIAAVNTALRLITDPQGRILDLRLAAGGVAPIPLLIGGMERFRGKPVDEATAKAVAQTAADAVKPIDDVRGSAAYKKQLLHQLVLAHFAAAAAPGAAR
ncbi:MAG TPA: FAD binding domain-containing protein [Elusimicrobiota bacterium]|nr:FAD binding domain-containing protein [Elusimicrobiota bacterium]